MGLKAAKGKPEPPEEGGGAVEVIRVVWSERRTSTSDKTGRPVDDESDGE